MKLDEIKIRTELKPGDIGYLIYLHGKIYHEEKQHGIEFEVYVAEGFIRFFKNYDPRRDRIWICEHQSRIIGSVAVMNMKESALLKFFLLDSKYRGIKLGNKLMTLFIDFMKSAGYRHSFLWTTNELPEAAHLYKKFGYKLTENKPSTAFGKQLVEQRYDLELD